MLLAEVVAASDAVASTRSRRAKVERLSDLLATAGPDEVRAVVGFLSGEPRQGKIGVGYAAVYRIDVPPAERPGLTVREVDGLFGRIPAVIGPGSQVARRDLLEATFRRATAEEQDFLRRLLTGELRQGALEGMMAEAIARAAAVPPADVRRAVMLDGDLGAVAEAALAGGEAALAAFGLVPGRPVRPMLAQTASDVAAALGSIGGASSVEWKLDGARIQAHRAGSEVGVFTRNLNDVTDRLPHVVEVIRGLPAGDLVLDGESMAMDDDGLPRPFHETMSRFGADVPADRVPVMPFFFDVLHADGEDLIDLPLHARLERLDTVVPEAHRVPRIVGADADEALGFLREARRHRHEGLMVKSLDSVYEAGARGSAWLKVKPAHALDLVVLAAEWGHGRRTGFLSNLHLGARDPSTGRFVMLGKTFKGLTDEMLAWQTERLLELEERRTRGTVHVRPELVVEVAFDGVVPSPRYPGGMALRFARVKGYRPDKAPGDADTIGAVADIFEGRI